MSTVVYAEMLPGVQQISRMRSVISRFREEEGGGAQSVLGEKLNSPQLLSHVTQPNNAPW